MNGTQSPDAQKALNANSNGSNSNNSSLAAKKRKKDLKPIITMEGANQTDDLGNFMVAPCSACRIETARTKSAWSTQVICDRWFFARATASPTSFGAHWYLRLSIHRIRDFATDMKLRSRLAYVWRLAKVNGGPNHANIILFRCPGNTQQHGVACCVTSQGTAVKQVETSVDIAHSGIVPFALSLWGTVGLGLDRTTRPHKSWAFTNLESLDRSLGPSVPDLSLACPGRGALGHSPTAPFEVPGAALG
ncbi:unnamed protein product [Fusarium venenatum]|uniref:Uncharacterized protein n=1 Tax=Fusarium venenatum TaxID=56646 RepID=A0A2L2T7T7_9HYPO|nr:uncharacterized protein FVRRES_05677 [Fusarium venenatum]CEI61241.1 unnamed protein product [Fusarium venenatum]